MITVLDGVREFNDGLPVELVWSEGRVAVRAWNEAGCNATEVDLHTLLFALEKLGLDAARVADMNG